MFGLLKKFKDGLSKTVSAIAAKTGSIFGGKKIDASSLETLEEALYTADFGVETATEILDEIKAAYRKDKELRGQEAAAIGAEVLRRVLEGAEGKLEAVGGGGSAAANPVVIAMIGVNGSGKTTTSAKLAWRLKEDGKSVTLGSTAPLAISAKTQHPKEAQEFLAYWTSKDVQEKFSLTTGFPPLRTDLASDSKITSDPTISVFNSQVGTSRMYLPRVPSATKVDSDGYVQLIGQITRGTDVATATAQAATTINNLTGCKQ